MLDDVALVASAPAAAGVVLEVAVVLVGAAVLAPKRPPGPGAEVDAGAAVVGVAAAAVVVVAPPKRPEVAAVVAGAAAVVAGGAPKSDLLAAGAGERAAAAVVAGAEVVVAENKEGFEAGAELAVGVGPRPPKRPPGAEVVVAVVLAGAVVAAGLAPNREVVPTAAGSAGLGVDDNVPLNKLGVEAAGVLPPNKPPGFCAGAVVDDAPALPPPKRFVEGVLAEGCEEGVALDPPKRPPPAAGFEAPPNSPPAGFDSA